MTDQRVQRKRRSTKLSRVFSTLTAIDPSTGNMLPEQFQYVYDTQGRTIEATFAMTPQSWTPSNGASYYDASHRAATRGRAHYDYDANGRTKGVYNWWDTWNSGSSSYSSAPIRANECAYETSGLNRGLKTQNKFYNVTSGAWNLQRTESYGYDANLDYLTSTNYGDGLSNATPSWTYDAAGNRASDSTNTGAWTYDNLNRMTASPGTTYTNDILGNRLAKGTGTYTWDDMNRMTANVTNGATCNYVYRADGMRVQKESHTGSTNSTLVGYRYEGQMGIEDYELASTNGGLTYSVSAISRNAIGARGIDAISRTTSSGSAVTYPLYDAHGNGVGSLSKSGTSWSISDEKSYDAWGGIRSGGTSDNKSRYCASVGHKQDDESGLVYMRARYYDTNSARFTSEDPARHGLNWFVYAQNSPTNYVDSSGKIGQLAAILLGAIIGAIAAAITTIVFELSATGKVNLTDVLTAAAIGALAGAIVTAIACFCPSAAAEAASTLLANWSALTLAQAIVGSAQITGILSGAGAIAALTIGIFIGHGVQIKAMLDDLYEDAAQSVNDGLYRMNY